MIEFEDHYHARSSFALFWTFACVAIGLSLAIVIEDVAAKLLGGVFVVFGGVGVYSAWKKQAWHLQIVSGTLTWSYPKSWKPAAGSVVLTEVVRAEINDDLSIPAVTLVLRTGETKKILLAGFGHSLYEHLSARYPQISLSYVPSNHLMG